MKTSILIICTILVISCARKTYTDKSANVQGQTFAIIPFDVSIQKRANDTKTTQLQLSEKAKNEAIRYQSSAHSYILSKQKDFIVAFQDPNDTNVLLKKAGITFENLNDFTKGQLSKILKVDGILTGKLYRKEIMSQEIGKSIDIFTKLAKLPVDKMTTNEAQLNLSLYTKQDNRIIWTYQYDLSGTSDFTPEHVTASLMQDAARKFPYRKK